MGSNEPLILSGLVSDQRIKVTLGIMENKNLRQDIIGKNPNSKLMKEYKNSLIFLSPIQEEMAIGLSLGNLSIQKHSHKLEARLKFEWKDKNYSYHIYNSFKEWIITPPKKKIRINKNNNQVITYRF